MTPVHSVIVPVLNGAAYVRDCIESALAQLGPDDEVLVVDNGSTDASVATVSAIADRRVQLLAEGRPGPGAARNAGLRLARGHYVTFLDCDDLWAPGRLAVMSGALERAPGANAVYGRVRVRYERGLDPIHSGIDGQFVHNWAIWSYMFERSLLERVGLLDETLPMGEDIDYILRLRRAGMTCAVCEEIVSIYRRHEGNVTNDRESVQATFMQTLSKNIARVRAERKRGPQ